MNEIEPRGVVVVVVVGEVVDVEVEDVDVEVDEVDEVDVEVDEVDEVDVEVDEVDEVDVEVVEVGLVTAAEAGDICSDIITGGTHTTPLTAAPRRKTSLRVRPDAFVDSVVPRSSTDTSASRGSLPHLFPA